MEMRHQRGKRSEIAPRLAVSAGFIAALHSVPAFAYLDPGTGSIILQGLLAAFAMVAAAGSLFWKRIKDFFSSIFSRKDSRTTEPQQDPET